MCVVYALRFPSVHRSMDHEIEIIRGFASIWHWLSVRVTEVLRHGQNDCSFLYCA